MEWMRRQEPPCSAFQGWSPGTRYLDHVAEFVRTLTATKSSLNSDESGYEQDASLRFAVLNVSVLQFDVVFELLFECLVADGDLFFDQLICPVFAGCFNVECVLARRSAYRVF